VRIRTNIDAVPNLEATMRLFVLLLLFALNSYATVSASAHQIHGTLGAPDATITLDSKQLPPPPSN
jgi:hypothetical protein